MNVWFVCSVIFDSVDRGDNLYMSGFDSGYS